MLSIYCHLWIVPAIQDPPQLYTKTHISQFLMFLSRIPLLVYKICKFLQKFHWKSIWVGNFGQSSPWPGKPGCWPSFYAQLLYAAQSPKWNGGVLVKGCRKKLRKSWCLRWRCRLWTDVENHWWAYWEFLDPKLQKFWVLHLLFAILFCCFSQKFWDGKAHFLDKPPQNNCPGDFAQLQAFLCRGHCFGHRITLRILGRSRGGSSRWRRTQILIFWSQQLSCYCRKTGSYWQ